jgi:hypothetical protein
MRKFDSHIHKILAANFFLSIRSGGITMHSFGAWLSSVERTVRDREVGGSNPLAPTKI